jgi:hypothetical protein
MLKIPEVAINISVVSASLILCSGCSDTTDKGRNGNDFPNIIFIFTDQQNVNAISAHGNPYLNTPNQDFFSKKWDKLYKFLLHLSCKWTCKEQFINR